MSPSAPILPVLCHAVRDSRAASTRRWLSWVALVYGTLDGQRGVDAQAMAEVLGLRPNVCTKAEGIVALHLWAGMSANVIANAIMTGAPERFLDQLDAQGLARAASVPGGTIALLPHAAILDELDADARLGLLAALRARASSALAACRAGQGWAHVTALYLEKMPRNVLHSLGEFYTSPWLASWLVIQSGWRPGERLLDPFVGPGAFLCAALRQARQEGVNPLSVLPDLAGLDINPTACALARAAVLLEVLPEASGVVLSAPNIIHADALLGAVLAGSPDAPEVCFSGHRIPRPVDLDAQAAAAAAQRLPGVPQWRSTTGDPRALRPELGLVVEPLTGLALTAADVVVTNPPWVGWEYQSRQLRAHLQPAWRHHSLDHRGRHRGFLKEDLSTLATVASLDRYLRDGGRAVALLPEASLSAAIAAGGLRRLSVFEGRGPLRLDRIDLFDDVRVFPSAQAVAMSWLIQKGAPTTFPVPVHRWVRRVRSGQPAQDATLASVLQETKRIVEGARPLWPSKPRSRWMVGTTALLEATHRLRGDMPYTARIGVFTGGANAVYYVEPVGAHGPGTSVYRNVRGRAKRSAPQVSVPLEDALVYPVVRGRDLKTWAFTGQGWILCPHTAQTRLRAIPQAEMRRRYPCALSYLEQMRAVLDDRRGFALWERAFQAETFYAMQRIGTYSFSLYKVVWKYISSDFTVAALGPDRQGRPVLANDKVVSIAVESEAEAHYLAGVLTSTPVRWQVLAQTSGRQISVSAIENLAVPRFNPDAADHMEIVAASRRGHRLRLGRPRASIAAEIAAIDAVVVRMLGLSVQSLPEMAAAIPRIP